MTSTDTERLERERLDADRRYNDALTELDRAVADVTSETATPGDGVGRLMSVLITFLQQITAFVETKDRQLAADAACRLDALGPTLSSVAELRIQVGVLQRAIQMLTRQGIGAQPAAIGAPPSATGARPSEIGPHPSATLAQPPPIGHDADDYRYVGFEDEFRGSSEIVQERLRAYVPLFAGRSNVLDIGCGRGELLSALQAAGVEARGVDTNTEMVAVARDRGLVAQHADALTYLSSMPDDSLGGVIATQVIEHLEPSYLMRLLETASHKLQAGAPIVLETINAACWLAFFSSYLRDFTHVRPVHPETLQYLLRATGFTRVEIRYSAPVPAHMKMKTIDLPAEVLGSSDAPARALAQVAHAVNANAVILNNLMFTHLDYAAIGYRS